MPNIQPLRVGDVLHGYCGGYFGRDGYECKTVEAVGSDWVVARTRYSGVWWANVSPEQLTEYREVKSEFECDCD